MIKIITIIGCCVSGMIKSAMITECCTLQNSHNYIQTRYYIITNSIMGDLKSLSESLVIIISKVIIRVMI